jgi:hypothetical protein
MGSHLFTVCIEVTGTIIPEFPLQNILNENNFLGGHWHVSQMMCQGKTQLSLFYLMHDSLHSLAIQHKEDHSKDLDRNEVTDILT